MRDVTVTEGTPLNSASKTRPMPCFYFICLFTEHGSHYNSSLFCHESLVSRHVPRFKFGHLAQRNLAQRNPAQSVHKKKPFLVSCARVLIVCVFIFFLVCASFFWCVPGIGAGLPPRAIIQVSPKSSGPSPLQCAVA